MLFVMCLHFIVYVQYMNYRTKMYKYKCKSIYGDIDSQFFQTQILSTFN